MIIAVSGGKKGGDWRLEIFLSFKDHLNLGLATLDGEECWQAKLTNPM